MSSISITFDVKAVALNGGIFRKTRAMPVIEKCFLCQEP